MPPPLAHEPTITSEASTSPLRTAMADYEAARIRYREVVLASLDGRADGPAIRAAIDGARVAYAALERCRSGAESPSRPEPRRPASRWIPRLARRLARS